jgi:L-ribulokinase
VAVYERLYPIYRELYFAMGSPNSAAIGVGEVLPMLREIAAGARG